MVIINDYFIPTLTCVYYAWSMVDTMSSKQLTAIRGSGNLTALQTKI